MFLYKKYHTIGLCNTLLDRIPILDQLNITNVEYIWCVFTLRTLYRLKTPPAFPPSLCSRIVLCICDQKTNPSHRAQADGYETAQKCSCFTSSSTDWNSLSSTARSIKTVPWLVQWKVRYGLAPAALQITRFKSNKNTLMQAGAAELMFYEIDTHPAVLPEASQCLWWVYAGVRKRWCRSPWAPRDPCQPTHPEWSNGKRTQRYKHEETSHYKEVQRCLCLSHLFSLEDVPQVFKPQTLQELWDVHI